MFKSNNRGPGTGFREGVLIMLTSILLSAGLLVAGTGAASLAAGAAHFLPASDMLTGVRLTGTLAACLRLAGIAAVLPLAGAAVHIEIPVAADGHEALITAAAIFIVHAKSTSMHFIEGGTSPASTYAGGVLRCGGIIASGCQKEYWRKNR